MRAIAPDGIEIAFQVFGAGVPTLVLVHGWSCDRSYWQHQVETLSRRYPHLDLGEVVLIGHSMGGDVVLEAARQLTYRVRGIVCVDTYSQLAQFSTLQQVRARIAPFERSFVPTTRQFVQGMFPANADAVLVERVAADMSAAPPEVALPALKAAWTFGSKVPGILRSLNIPVTAINSEDPPSDLESMHGHGIDVVCVSGVGHFMMMEQPDRFNECLVKVISSFAAGGAK